MLGRRRKQPVDAGQTSEFRLYLIARPAELEVYLGDTGIYYRQINAEGEAAVTAGGPVEIAPGTLLYTF